jgi:uncharacterized protein
MRRLLLAALTCFTLSLTASDALAAPPPAGGTWREEYIPCNICNPSGAAGGEATRLHADVFRPEGLPDDAKTPVIITVTPYGNHTGSTTEAGVTNEGPNDRFYDFLEVGRVLQKGYTYVMVDLPGFGGSSGCNDWGGPVERGASKIAVEWAASQPWSTGKVGMIGKSYDAWTGLMAIAEKPKGLEAVVAMEPVYSGYRYFWTYGVRISQTVGTGGLFQAIDAKPGSLSNDPMYTINGAPQAYCYGPNVGLQNANDSEDSDFYVARNLIPAVKGSTVPLFLTQGYLEDNTKQDGAFELFNNMAGPKYAWFGQFEHVRGWERTDAEPKYAGSGDFKMGRSDFAAQMMRFFDRYLKGDDTGIERDPSVWTQDMTGRYRAEDQWPPKDVVMRTTDLKTGSYTDDGGTRGEADTSNGADGIWSISAPLPYDVWVAGEPVVDAVVSNSAPRSNMAVHLYDISPDGKAALISRSVYLLRSTSNEVTIQMYGQDFPVQAGHRLGFRISSADGQWWQHVHTRGTVTVEKASVRIPFLTKSRSAFGEGQVTPFQSAWVERAPFPIDTALFESAATTFDLPGKLQAPAPGGSPVTPVGAPGSFKLTAKAKAGKKRRVTVRGVAPAGSKLTITITKGTKRAARKTLTLKGARTAYKTVLKLKKKGTYRVTVTARGAGGATAKAFTRVRVK